MSAKQEQRTAGPIEVAEFHFRVEGNVRREDDEVDGTTRAVLLTSPKDPNYPRISPGELRATTDGAVRELLGDEFAVAWLEIREGSLEIVFLITSTLAVISRLRGGVEDVQWLLDRLGWLRDSLNYRLRDLFESRSTSVTPVSGSFAPRLAVVGGQGGREVPQDDRVAGRSSAWLGLQDRYLSVYAMVVNLALIAVVIILILHD